MSESELALSTAVIERALQGYAPEDAQQVSALVSGLATVLPLETALPPEGNEHGTEPLPQA